MKNILTLLFILSFFLFPMTASAFIPIEIPIEVTEVSVVHAVKCSQPQYSWHDNACYVRCSANGPERILPDIHTQQGCHG